MGQSADVGNAAGKAPVEKDAEVGRIEHAYHLGRSGTGRRRHDRTARREHKPSVDQAEALDSFVNNGLIAVER